MRLRTAVMLLLCIAQLGPALVLFPAVAWLFWSGQSGWGIFLLVWASVVVTMTGAGEVDLFWVNFQR